MPRRSVFCLFRAVQQATDPVPDAELLRRFVAARDPAAFELLAHRHAGAVWAACVRILRNDADADDALQATFLVLARKAGTVRGPCIGGWLYQIAAHIALKLKASRGRAGGGDSTPADRLAHPGHSPETMAEHGERDALLHQELARLPERYRLPVVLCDLEGHTHAQAAKLLHWPVGTVSGRLSRAHQLLRDRLTRRGVGVPAVGLGVALTATPISAEAIRAVVGVAAGSIPVPPAVSILTKGVLTAMRTAKLKVVTATVVGLLGLAGTGTVVAFTRTGILAVPAVNPDQSRNAVSTLDAPLEDDWVPQKATDPVPTAFPDIRLPDRHGDMESLKKVCPRILGDAVEAVAPTDDTYQKLLKARLNQGRLEVSGVRMRIAIGQWNPGDQQEFVRCLDDMRAVTIELWANDLPKLIPWLEEFLILAKEDERFVEARVASGSDRPQALNAARRHRLEVETVLWKAKNPTPRRR